MRSVVLVVAAVALVTLAAWAAEKEAPLPALEVVNRFELPGSTDKAGFVDVRWASKDSVYLADHYGTITEVRLAKGLPEIRRVAPPPRDSGLRTIRHLAITDRWIVVAHMATVAWRRNEPDSHWQVTKQRAFFHDFDISGDEIVMLGWPPGKGYEGLERGGMVWRANLSDGLDRWDVLYESAELARDLESIRTNFSLGSIRFLRRGGFVVGPSFVPGVLQLSASGTVKRRWSPRELWGEEQKAWTSGQRDPEKLAGFLAAGRTVDQVLALPEGPAIVVRESQGGRPRYRLGLLGPEIQWFEIPVDDRSGMARLRGDVDDKGRIVLARVLRVPFRIAFVGTSEVVVLRLPL